MEKYVSIGSSFLKKQYLPHILLTLLFCLISGFFVSFRNLKPEQAAKVMEMYAAFTGILLLPPLFLPEQDQEIWLLEKSKAMPLWKLYLIRILEAAVVLILVVTAFEAFLYLGNSQFNPGRLWLGSFTEILFLGSIGYFVSGVTNQVVLGYMVSVIYFVVNIGGRRYLGKFALFQMMKGSYDFVIWMAAAIVLLLAGGILIREKTVNIH